MSSQLEGLGSNFNVNDLDRLVSAANRNPNEFLEVLNRPKSNRDRAMAAMILGKAAKPDFVEPLSNCLKDTDTLVRSSASEALRDIFSTTSDSVSKKKIFTIAISQMLKDPIVSQSGIEIAVRSKSEDAIEPLCGALVTFGLNSRIGRLCFIAIKSFDSKHAKDALKIAIEKNNQRENAIIAGRPVEEILKIR